MWSGCFVHSLYLILDYISSGLYNYEKIQAKEGLDLDLFINYHELDRKSVV